MDTQFFTIKQLTATNIKSLKDFNADMNNMSVLLFGSEEAGKTNVWQVANLLKRIPSAVVSKGEKQGEATITISKGDVEYKFQFSFTEDGKHKLTTLVSGEDKKVTQARQSYIIEQLLAQSFNIDALINSSGQKQVDIIKQAFNIDTNKEEAYYKQKFDTRKDLKRDLVNNPKPTEVPEVKEVSLNDLLAEKKKIEEFNAEQDAKQGVINYYLEIAKKLNSAITEPNSDSYVDYIATANNINKELALFITEKIKTLDQPKEYKPFKKVDLSISNAQKTNSDALLHKSYLINLKKHNDLLEQVEVADKDVLEARTQLLQKIQQVEIPIKDLSFEIQMSEAGVLSTTLMYNGLPFDDSSVNTSKKFAIAAKMQMGLFKEGNLAIMHVNSSFMSESTVKELAEECKLLGIQCLFEITSRKDNEPLTVTSIL